MKKTILVCLLGISILSSCNNNDGCKDEKCKKPIANEKINSKDSTMDKQGIVAKNGDNEITCKLTSEELWERKKTVITSLKKQIIEKKELENGYAYRFKGDDKVIDELIEFIKSERSCCSFFVFGLSFSGHGTEAWLNLTGPDGAKKMIDSEIGL